VVLGSLLRRELKRAVTRLFKLLVGHLSNLTTEYRYQCVIVKDNVPENFAIRSTYSTNARQPANESVTSCTASLPAFKSPSFDISTIGCKEMGGGWRTSRSLVYEHHFSLALHLAAL
jgi:hypothetical protein